MRRLAQIGLIILLITAGWELASYLRDVVNDPKFDDWMHSIFVTIQ